MIGPFRLVREIIDTISDKYSAQAIFSLPNEWSELNLLLIDPRHSFRS